jgi:hypothetical protein
VSAADDDRTASRASASRHIAAGVALALAACVVAGLIPLLFGSPDPLVHVTWRDLGDAERLAIEEQFSLTEAAVIAIRRNMRQRRTWSTVFGVSAAGSFDLPRCVVDEGTAKSFVAAASGDRAKRRRVARELAECIQDRPDVQVIGMVGDRRVFDWDTGRFGWKRGLDVIGPLRADWLRD